MSAISLATLASTSMVVLHTPQTRLRVPHAPRCFFPAPPETEEKPFCYGLSGNNFPVLGGNFDPFYFTYEKSELEVMRLREAELVHCRVGMLASLGFMVQENYHPLFSGAGGTGLQQISEIPIAAWLLMTLGIGFCEVKRLQAGWNPEKPSFTGELREGYKPGDLGFDPLGLKPTDPVKLKEFEEIELNNGRLAMLAAIGFISEEAATGQTWGSA
jgi:hypothetical protein